ncbi:MAG: hypothetical protein V3W41_15565 [Planctomycetota bacterium]
MDTSAPRFNSAKIQKAVEAATRNFAKADVARNQISDDIRTLESYLQSSAVEIEFRFRLGSPILSSIPHESCAPGELHEEFLSWSANAGGQFRLTYELGKFEDHEVLAEVGDNSLWEVPSGYCEARPLIETPFEVRHRLYPALSEFIDALAEALSVEDEPDEKTSLPS